MDDNSLIASGSESLFLDLMSDTQSCCSEDYDAGASSDEDMESRISYLAAKQSILQRASHIILENDAFGAQKATKLLQTGKISPQEKNELWDEAATMLRTLNNRQGKTDPETKKVTPPTRPRKRKTPMDPDIDYSTVDKVHDMETVDPQETNHAESELMSLCESCHQGPSDAFQPRVISTKTSIHQDLSGVQSLEDHNWQTDAEQRTTNFLQAVSMQEAIDMAQATSLCEEAHIVAQTTSPYAIVFANRAFLKHTSESVIGRPLESIVHFRADLPSEATLQLKNQKLTCRIQIAPVVDLEAVSHILVRVTGIVHSPKATRLPVPKISLVGTVG